MTTGSLAFLIAFAVMIQIAALMLLGLGRQWIRFRGLDQEAAAIPPVPAMALQAGAMPSAGPSTSGWGGFRDFIVQRRVIEDMAGSVCSFYLVPADGSALPAFKPGQYLTFRFEIDDPRSGERKAVQRCYSLSERPRPDYFRISVKRVPSPLNAPVLPPGLSSSFLHDCVREGARLVVKAPSGSFHLAEGDAPRWS